MTDAAMTDDELAARDALRLRALSKSGNLGSTMVALYALEINCGLSSFWDGGWTVWIGDEMNGHHAEWYFVQEDFGKIAPWLRSEAARLVRKWKRGRAATVRRDAMKAFG